MPVISARFNSDSRTAFSIGKYKNAFLRPNECNSVIPTKRPSRNQLVWIIIASVIIFIFFTPVIVAAQFQQSHFIITPTCVQQPCRLAQPGNSSTGYIDIDRRVNVTVYESIGFKYLCIGLQISIPLGVGSVGCGPISHSQLGADVTIYPESCSIAGTSPSADFSSKTDNPRCFLKLSNSGSAGTWATACNVGGLSGALLTADGASALEQIQIPSGGVAYLECQVSGVSASPGEAVTGTVSLANGANHTIHSELGTLILTTPSFSLTSWFPKHPRSVQQLAEVFEIHRRAGKQPVRSERVES